PAPSRASLTDTGKLRSTRRGSAEPANGAGSAAAASWTAGSWIVVQRSATSATTSSVRASSARPSRVDNGIALLLTTVTVWDATVGFGTHANTTTLALNDPDDRYWCVSVGTVVKIGVLPPSGSHEYPPSKTNGFVNVN